jgi:co-chaperonin GroES (HSP10)
MSDQHNVINLSQAVDLSVVLNKEAEERAKQLPIPQGYRILCAIPEAEKEFESGIIKPDEMVRHDELLTTVLFVVDMGPDCYKDEERYPTGPWCKEKDWVIFARYAGSRLPIEGGEVRILNDDEVLGTIPDPESVLHYI